MELMDREWYESVIKTRKEFVRFYEEQRDYDIEQIKFWESQLKDDTERLSRNRAGVEGAESWLEEFDRNASPDA